MPADAEASGLPIAVFRVELRNRSTQPVEAAVCASLPNFVGMDGSKTKRDWKGDPQVLGAAGNRNAFRRTADAQGLFLSSEKVDPKDPAWGSLALVTTPDAVVTTRTGWAEGGWSGALLDFWDDFLADGRLDEREAGATDTPMASLAVSIDLAPGQAREALFLLAWHFPNRTSWTPKADPPGPEDWVGNHYATRFADAWDVAEKTLPRLPELQRRTVAFVSAFAGERPARRGQGGRALQPLDAAHADLLPHRRRPLLRLGGLRRHRRLLPRLVHARLELRAGDAVPVRRALARHARGRVRPRHERSGPHELPRGAADRARAGVRQGRRRRPDGLRPQDVPGLAALRRRGAPALPVAEGPQGRRVLLDPRRLGRRPRRGHGGLPAQHHGRRVLRPEPADGPVVPRRPARGRGDGAARGRCRLRPRVPAALRERLAVDRREPVERRVLRAPRGAAEEQGRRGARASSSAWARAT